MTTGQKCRTLLFSVIPLLTYLLLTNVITALPLFIPALHSLMFLLHVVALAASVLLGFLLFRKNHEISPNVLHNSPFSDLLPPVMAALFLYASAQLLEMFAFRHTQQLMDGMLSGEMDFLDFLSLLTSSSTGFAGGWQNALFLLVLAPVGEAILLRYFPLTLCRKFASLPVLCIGSGILSALVYGGGLLGIVHHFLLGAVLALLFLKTGKLWHCILAHMLFNATTMILQFQYSWHMNNHTGYTGAVWAVIQLVLLAVPVIWFFRNSRKSEP